MGKYDAMTVNERLFEARLLDKFDQAVRERNKASMVSLLLRVDFNRHQAENTADSILENPKFFGYS